jgi:hypothetical protein
MDSNNKNPLIRKVDDNVRFVVDVQAFPDFDSVQLIWYKNGEIIKQNDEHYKTRSKKDGQNTQVFLFISHIRLEDSGTYVLVSITYFTLLFKVYFIVIFYSSTKVFK